MSWFRRRKTATKRRRSANTKTQRLIAFARRFGLRAGAGAFVLWLAAWLVLGGVVTRTGLWAQEKSYDLSAAAGFAVRDILVEGRVYTDADVLLALINIERGDPLFSFDPVAARELIEKISWVYSAHVERRLPDTIYIGLTERKPLALWQHEGKVRVIDEAGVILTDQDMTPFKALPIVVGEKAADHAVDLLMLIAAEPLLQERLEAAIWIGNRRWDLKLKNGIKIKLPEDDLGFALRRLALAQEEDGLLDKDITIINARERDRLTVRTRPGAVETYKAGMSGEL